MCQLKIHEQRVLDNSYIFFDSSIHNLIKIWNKKQQKFASTNNFKVLDINKLMTNKKYFVKNIEPSNDGGRIIANAIIDSL